MLLPKSRALEELSELVPDKRLAGQLYDHWLKRRQQHGGPLLERLWFEVPWKFVAFAHLLGDEEGDDEMLPFMANESRSAKRRAGARRRVNDEDALEALHALRSELEVRVWLAMGEWGRGRAGGGWGSGPRMGAAHGRRG